MLVPDDTQSVQFHWAHLQPPHRVDEGDGNDGQAEYQYNDGKKPKRSMASSEAADIAIDVPALQNTRQRIRNYIEKESTEVGTETSILHY